MKTAEEKEESIRVSKRRLVGSACVFALCYLVLITLIFVMVVIAHGNGWKQYVSGNASRLLTLMVSCFFLYCIVYYYFLFEDREFFLQARNILLVFSVLTLAVMLCFLIGKFVNIYARPTIMLALLFVFLFNRRETVLLNFVFAMLMFVIDIYTADYVAFDTDNASYFSLIFSFVCGTFGIFASGKVKTRLGVLLTGCFIAVPTIFITLLLKLPSAYNNWIEVIASVGFSVLGCVISAVLALALLPVLEAVFNRLTVFRLREFTSTSAPILVRLKREAPGTFNHSLIVAHLAETCAVAIGENAELARAAGYYHDVGKLKQPDCFTENQTDYNVHDELTPELSADIIRSHAGDGYELITAAHLPEIIADVAREHHGTMPIKYFYNKAMRLSGGDVDVKDYSYLGPTPRTRIAAIVMIADASEAAVRALQDRSPETVERLVRGIIEERMDLDQFDECDITMKQLTVIKETIVEALSGVHHHRVKYPAIRFNRERQAVEEKTE